MRWLGFCGIGAALVMAAGEKGPVVPEAAKARPLPAPALTGSVSLEEAIARRRSMRSFSREALKPGEVGQLCWAGQGITDARSGYRASPSAGALFPIELYVVTPDGVDRYLPREHALQRHLEGDCRRALQRVAVGQEAVGEAPATFVVAAVVERTARKYGRRAERYCLLEAGHVAQNILLQAVALNLGGVPVGAYEDEAVAAALKLPKGTQVLYLLPIGRPR